MSTNEEIVIKKVHTFTDLVIAGLVAAAGVGIYFILPGWGILFCLVGVLLFIFYKGADKRVGDSTILKEKSLDLDPGCRNAIIAFLDGEAAEPELQAAPEGDHLYLEVYYNADAAVAYARLYDVAQNSFEPATKMVELRGPRAEKLISRL